MSCLTCGHPAEMHRHHNRYRYCDRPDGCNSYKAPRRWWQLWRKP